MKDFSKRLPYGILAALVTTFGLLWRKRFFHFPHFISKYGADSLWALLVFLGFRFLAPRRPVWQVALAATVFSFAIEFSQLWHEPWLDAIRGTTLGRLILGSVFNWPDFGSYLAGIALGVLLDAVIKLISPNR